MANKVDWTEAEDAILKDPVDGYIKNSAGYLLRLLPGRTRNAIIGRCNRLHILGDPDKPTNQNTWKPHKRRPSPPRYTTPQSTSQAIAMKRQAKVNRDALLETLPGDCWAPIAGTSPVHLYDHRENQCRWPVGTADTFTGYCGCQVSKAPYCAAHTELSKGAALGEPMKDWRG